MRPRIAWGALAVLLLAGCGSPRPVGPVARSDAAAETGVGRTASVGEVVYRRAPGMVQTGAILDVSVTGFIAAARYNVPSGTRLNESRLGNATWYCTPGRAVSSLVGVPMGAACFRDTDGDGRFDTIDNTVGGFGATPFGPLPYRKTEWPYGDGTLYDVLLLEVGEKSVTLRHRELRTNPVQPIQSDIVHPVERPDQEIDSNGIAFRIHAIEPGGIAYSVIAVRQR